MNVVSAISIKTRVITLRLESYTIIALLSYTENLLLNNNKRAITVKKIS